MEHNIFTSKAELREILKSVVVEVMGEQAAASETMNSEQVMEFFHISRVTLWRWMHTGKLPFHPGPGRRMLFYRGDVEKLARD